MSAAGCASAPPPTELVAARQAYRRAANGPANTVVPAELHKAQVALQKAEGAFVEEPEAQRTRDLAYVAARKAQLAEALATAQLDLQAKAKAERDLQAEQARRLTQTRQELGQTQRQLTQEVQLTEQERMARLQAEQKAAQAEQTARDALNKLAQVSEEQRGLVITLSGSVLFPTNQTVLLPEAQTRLNQVAEALMATKERALVIEGHTDSRGNDGHNFELSRMRAEAVRDYLVSRGYPADKIQAVGMGKSRPVADNASAEGRANNRRVEIVVQPRGKSLAERPRDGL